MAPQPQKLHIAILDTDVPIPQVYAERGLYSTQFRTLLRAAASRLNSQPVEIHTTAFDAVGGCLPPLECLRTATSEGSGPLGPIDGILITGSAAAAYDITHQPWIAELQKFIQCVYAEYPEVKMFGSCFGHQIIAQALLGVDSSSCNGSTKDVDGKKTAVKVEYSPEGHEVGIVPITLDEQFKSAFPILSNLPTGSFRLQLIHGDRVVSVSDPNVVSLPDGWVNLGHTAKCSIQGLYKPSRVLTYQGHFEFDTFVNRETCFAFAKRGNWPSEKVEKFVKQIEVAAVPGKEDDDDSKVAAEVVVQFFGGYASA